MIMTSFQVVLKLFFREFKRCLLMIKNCQKKEDQFLKKITKILFYLFSYSLYFYFFLFEKFNKALSR